MIVKKPYPIIAKYYNSISLQRFAELLEISIEELEEQICCLVNTKQIYAKIDRPKGRTMIQLAANQGNQRALHAIALIHFNFYKENIC